MNATGPIVHDVRNPAQRESAAPARMSGRRRLASAALGTLRWGLVVVLLVSAARKATGHDAFRTSLTVMGMFPLAVVPVLAVAVPVTEALAAVFVGLRRAELAGLALTMLLSASFAGLHLYVHINGIVAPCGCAGIIEVVASDANHLLIGLFCAGMFLAAFLVALFAPPRSIPR